MTVELSTVTLIVSVLIALIALVVAVLSPVLVARINLKAEKFRVATQLYTVRRLDNLERYFALAFSSLYSAGYTQAFTEVQYVIYLYAPPENHPMIDQLHRDLFYSASDNPELLESCRQKLVELSKLTGRDRYIG